MLFLSRINSSHHLRLQREGGSRKIDDDKGEAGGLIPPKRDDVIYEQPLMAKVMNYFHFLFGALPLSTMLLPRHYCRLTILRLSITAFCWLKQYVQFLCLTDAKKFYKQQNMNKASHRSAHLLGNHFPFLLLHLQQFLSSSSYSCVWPHVSSFGSYFLHNKSRGNS